MKVVIPARVAHCSRKMKQTCSSIGFRKIHFAGQRKTRKQSKKHKIPAIWAYVTKTYQFYHTIDQVDKQQVKIQRLNNIINMVVIIDVY